MEHQKQSREYRKRKESNFFNVLYKGDLSIVQLVLEQHEMSLDELQIVILNLLHRVKNLEVNNDGD